MELDLGKLRLTTTTDFTSSVGNNPTDIGSKNSKSNHERTNHLVAFWGLFECILFLDSPDMVNFQDIAWTVVWIDPDWILLLATPIWFARKIPHCFINDAIFGKNIIEHKSVL
jgi:hypothetical protein